jgi:hypothetical protein
MPKSRESHRDNQPTDRMPRRKGRVAPFIAGLLVGSVGTGAYFLSREVTPDPFDNATFQLTAREVLDNPREDAPEGESVIISFESQTGVSHEDITKATENRLEFGGVVGFDAPEGLRPEDPTCTSPSTGAGELVTELVVDCNFFYEPVTVDNPGTK